jgi:D-alanyl-lipoteichoic acid acyltransferase DltB (MBOAT superfamily)
VQSVTVPSFTFLGFALVVIGLFHISNAPRWRQGILLAANFGFIGSFVESSVSVLPYAGLLLLGGLGVAGRRALGAWSIWVFPPMVLIVFVWLKRYLFIPKELLLPQGYLQVGLSYVFFRIMHLVIDGWESMPRGVGGWISYLNYTLNFTSLVSGPIQRYEDYQRSDQPSNRLTHAGAWLAVERVVTGFFKVYIVSALLHTAHQSQTAAFSTGDGAAQILRGAALLGIYPVYLYFNFSGYTDFVIGIAHFLRIELPENFNRPFAAGNFITFWSRWHISLSTWLKTYVYNTSMLAAMRRTRSPKLEPLFGVTSYFLTFFLVGLWHGQTSEFVFFGVLTGGGVAANKLYQLGMVRGLGRNRYNRLTRNVSYAMLTRGLTFTWVAFTLLWFWSSWSQLEGFIKGMGAGGVTVAFVVLLGVAAIGLEALDRLGTWVRRRSLWGDPVVDSPYVRLALALDMILVVAFAAIAIHASPSHIVYQAF